APRSEDIHIDSWIDDLTRYLIACPEKFLAKAGVGEHQPCGCNVSSLVLFQLPFNDSGSWRVIGPLEPLHCCQGPSIMIALCTITVSMVTLKYTRCLKVAEYIRI